jgi:lipoprotein-releasing system permease protein
VGGLATGACVILLVMAVFNGLEGTILNFFNKFNPDIKVEVIEGKTFPVSDSLIQNINATHGVKGVAKSLEEIVLFEYKDKQEVGRIKGVSDNFNELSKFDSTVMEGKYKLHIEGEPGLVAGLGIGSSLGLNVLDPFKAVGIYALEENARPSSFSKPFNKVVARPTGMFAIQQEYDNEYVFAPLNLVQELLETQEISALEVYVEEGASVKDVINRLEPLFSDNFRIQDRYEQEKEFLRLMQLEKWLAFLMLALASMLVAFNMIGSLWMIVIDKRKDLSMLKCIGMTNGGVRNTILTLGAYIALLGIGIGVIIALGLYYLQISYGLVGVPENFVVSAYPVKLKFFDFILTLAIILIIGLVAAIPAANRAARIPAFYKVE